MSCPGGGSFDLISVCITNYHTTPDLVAMFDGTLAHDDRCDITTDQEQGTSEPLKAREMKCLNFNRGYKDLFSVDIVQIYRGNWGGNLVFDDITSTLRSIAHVTSIINTHVIA